MKKLNNHVTWCYLCFAIPLISSVIAVNWVTMNALSQQGKRISETGLESYTERLGGELQAIAEHLITFCTLESDIDNIQYISSGAEQVMATKRVLDRMKKDVLLYTMLEAEFLYLEHLDKWMTVRKNDLSFEKNQQVNIMIEEMCRMLEEDSEKLFVGKWQQYCQNEDRFLVYIASDEEASMGVIISIEEILRVPLPDDSEWTVQLLQDGVVAAETRQEDGIPSEKAVCLNSPIGNTGLELRVYIGKAGLYGSLNLQQMMLAILPVAVILTLGVLYYFTSYRIVRPVKKIVETMERAGTGDLQVRIATAGMLEELAAIGDTLNETFSKIDLLQSKEKESILEKQKSNLRNLQLQINPHFLGNCFNMLYNASLCGDNELVLEMTTHLRRYFRSMVQMEKDFILMQEELEFTNDFLAISKLRFPELNYEINVPEYLKKIPVPPSVIKSFAENAVQYSRGFGEDISVVVEAELMEEGEEPSVCVTIADNGPGFPQAILELLKTQDNLFFDGRAHIGIVNIRKRLEILYDQKACVELGNSADGGARIHVRLPLNCRKRGNTDVYGFDCG